MGQLLDKRLVGFEIKPNNDTLDWSMFIYAALADIPRFYFWTHGLAFFRETPRFECSSEAAYFDIVEEHIWSGFYEDPADEINDPDDDDYEDLPALADPDIKWLEYDALEEDFDLSEIETPEGLTIIVLPTSVFVAAPPVIPEDNEDTILDGFDLKHEDVPRVPIPCQLQIPS